MQEIYVAGGLYRDNGVVRGIAGFMLVDEDSGKFSIGNPSSISGLVLLGSERTELVFLTPERRFELMRRSHLEDLAGQYVGRSVPLDKVGIEEGEEVSLELF